MNRDDIAELSAIIEKMNWIGEKMNWIGEKPQEVFARVKPKWLPPAGEVATWVGARLPETVRSWLRTVAGEPEVLTRASLMKSAEEMFVRDLLTQRELVKFESTVGGPNYDAALLQRVVNFIKSGDWLESTPEWDKRRAILTQMWTPTDGGGNFGEGAARPSSNPGRLRGSKAIEQQVAGYGPGAGRGPKVRLGFDGTLKRLEALADEISQPSKIKGFIDLSDLSRNIQRAEELLSQTIEVWNQLQQRKDARDEV